MNLELEKRALEIKKIIGIKQAKEISAEEVVAAESSFTFLLKEVEDLIYKYAHKFPSLKQKYGIKDLFWRGTAVVWRSIFLYNPTKGIRFITYFTKALNGEFVSLLELTNRIPGGRKKSVNFKEFVLISLNNRKSESQILRDCKKYFPEYLKRNGKTLLRSVTEDIKQIIEMYDWKERALPEFAFDLPHVERGLQHRIIRKQDFAKKEEFRVNVERLFNSVTDPFNKKVLQTYLMLSHFTGQARFIDIANNLSVDVKTVYKAFGDVKRVARREDVFAV